MQESPKDRRGSCPCCQSFMGTWKSALPSTSMMEMRTHHLSQRDATRQTKVQCGNNLFHNLITTDMSLIMWMKTLWHSLFWMTTWTRSHCILSPHFFLGASWEKDSTISSMELHQELSGHNKLVWNDLQLPKVIQLKLPNKVDVHK